VVTSIIGIGIEETCASGGNYWKGAMIPKDTKLTSVILTVDELVRQFI
jgi:hypothetical protein